MQHLLPAIDSLTLEEKIGQMLCVGWGGVDALLNLNPQARRAISELQVGGMILMGRNLHPQTSPLPPIDTAALTAMTSEMQSLSAVPLLIATDQEGGRVARLREVPFTDFPTAQAIGEMGDSDIAYQVARAIGAELASVGINWDFAPVADVNSNPANPVIGDRAFGSTPETVTPMVVAQIRGFADGGVLSCVKHFPGHGDTVLDSHFDLPTLPFDLPAMEARELIPFRAAIAADVPTLMTAHILFPAVDSSGLPGTLSKLILTDLLRGTMGFDGLIITDCLEMRAVADHWGTARAALLAAQAGADMMLVCHTEARQRETYETLLDAARSGQLHQERIDTAVRRIFAAKSRALALTPAPVDSIAHAALARCLPAGTAFRGEPTTLGAEAPV